MKISDLSSPHKMIGITAVVCAIAAFLPWVSVFGISAAGVQGDGLITLIASLVGLAALAAHTGVISRPRIGARAFHVISAIGALLCAVIAVADMNTFSAIGLYLTLIGGIGWIAATIWSVRVSATRPPTEAVNPGAPPPSTPMPPSSAESPADGDRGVDSGG